MIEEVIEGRDAHGRFAPGPSPDRGRGRPPAGPVIILDEDMRRIIMATANLPVSIPRGSGRRVVTLYEAQIRKLATRKVHRRATVMHFIRLVQEAAALTPAPEPATPTAAAARVQDHLDRLLAIATSGDDAKVNRDATTFYELLLETTGRKPQA